MPDRADESSSSATALDRYLELVVAILFQFYGVRVYFLLYLQQLGDLVTGFVEWMAVIINQSIGKVKNTLNDFSVKEEATSQGITLAEDGFDYNHFAANAPGWASFLLDQYLGEDGIKSQILWLDIDAPEATEQMRKIAAELIREVLSTARSDVGSYRMDLSAKDLPAREKDYLETRCILFDRTINELIRRLDTDLNQHEHQLQAIDRIRRQHAALRVAKTKAKSQQADIKKQEEQLKVELDSICGKAQGPPSKGFEVGLRKLDDLEMMRTEVLHDMSDDFGDKKKEENVTNGAGTTSFGRLFGRADSDSSDGAE